MDLTGKLIIKATLGDDIRRIPIHNEELTYDELILMMQRVFRGQLSSTDDITLKYKDEDGDLITIFDSADVSFAVQYSRVLKLTLFVNGHVPKSSSGAFINNDIKEELRSIRDRVVKVLDALDDSRGGENAPDGEADNSAQVQSQTNMNGKLESREFDPLEKQQQQQSSQTSEQIRPSAATPPVNPATPVAPYHADPNHQNGPSYPNPGTDSTGASGQTYATPSSMASGVSSSYAHSQQQPAVSSGGFNPAYPQVQSATSAYPGAQPSPGPQSMLPRPPMSSSAGSIPPPMSLPSQGGAPSGGGFQAQGAMGAYRPPATSQPQPGYGYQGGQAPRPMYPPQSMASQSGGGVNHQPQQQSHQQQPPQAGAEGPWQGYRAPMSGAGPVGPGGAPPARPPVAGSVSPMNPYAKAPTQGGYAHAAPAPGYR